MVSIIRNNRNKLVMLYCYADIFGRMEPLLFVSSSCRFDYTGTSILEESRNIEHITYAFSSHFKFSWYWWNFKVIVDSSRPMSVHCILFFTRFPAPYLHRHLCLSVDRGRQKAWQVNDNREILSLIQSMSESNRLIRLNMRL